MADQRDDLEAYRDEAYFEPADAGERVFDSNLLREPVSVLPTRKAVVLSARSSVTEGIRAMQGEARGCVLVTSDGAQSSPVEGIFTERDVLFRVVDRGRNPATLPLAEVMTPEPECLRHDEPVAAALNKMSVGGFRHIPIVDADGRPVGVVSVRDVVEFLVEAFPREILNLPSERAAPTREREGA